MNNKYTRLFDTHGVLIVVFSALLTSSPAEGEDRMTELADMPGIIQKKDITARSWFADLQWPSKEIIRKARATPEQEMLIKPVVLRSLRRILQHSVLPEDLPDKLLPVRKQVENNDAVFTRFHLEDAVMQVVVTSARVQILYRNTAITRSTREGMLKLVEDSVHRLLKKSNEVLSNDFDVVEKDGALTGRNPRVRVAETREQMHQWVETVEWWTNGHLVYISVCLNPGTSSAFVDRSDWFKSLQDRK